LIILKAKYYVVEPYYMEGSTPDGPVVFSGSLYSNSGIIIHINTTK
jgi:hypothetical protein